MSDFSCAVSKCRVCKMKYLSTEYCEKYCGIKYILSKVSKANSNS